MTKNALALTQLITWGDNNNIPKEKLSRNLQELQNLKVLDLSNQSLSSLPEEIGALTLLKELYLFGNKLEELPQALSSLSNLEILWIQNNQLKVIPESISKLSKLKDIAAFSNHIVDISSKILSLPSLEALFLHNNLLDAQKIKELQELSKKIEYVSFYGQRN